jgi:hypothetical protein
MGVISTLRGSVPTFLGIILLGVLLSGCVGSGQTATSPQVAGPAFDENSGSIRGSVRTDEILPIIGAQVGVVGTPITAITDEAGAFLLPLVPPGSQTVAVIALGYHSTSKRVEVVAGTEVGVDFILNALPSTGPYHVTEHFKPTVQAYVFKLTVDCMYPVPGQSTVKSCVGGGGCPANTAVSSAPPGCMTEVGYGHCGQSGSPWASRGCDFTAEWQTIIGEVTWTPQSGVTGRGWLYEVLAPNVTRGTGVNHAGSVDQSDKHDWFAITSQSPIRHRIDDATFMDGSPSGTTNPVKEEDRCGGVQGAYTPGFCDWHWRVFAGWCTLNALTGGAAGCEKPGPDFAIDPVGQPVEIYFSYFIREPAPADWTALPDA